MQPIFECACPLFYVSLLFTHNDQGQLDIDWRSTVLADYRFLHISVNVNTVSYFLLHVAPREYEMSACVQ